MSINDFESIPEGVTSEPGKVVSKYLLSKEKLDAAISDAVSSSYDFGYYSGTSDTISKVVSWIYEHSRLVGYMDGNANSLSSEIFFDFDFKDLEKFLEELKTKNSY